jgi:hypothetical protein
VGIWSGGENIGQLGSMHRYIGYSRKIAGSGFVGRPPEYFHICVYYGLGLWDIKSRAPEYFPVYLEFGKCGCTGFVVPAPRIFSGVFRIWKMWVCRVCRASPRNIFRCIYNFENVGARVYGTGPRCIFVILKMQMHGFVGRIFWPCRIFSGYLEC